MLRIIINVLTSACSLSQMQNLTMEKDNSSNIKEIITKRQKGFHEDCFTNKKVN